MDHNRNQINFVKNILKEGYKAERQSSEAVDLLKKIVENAVFAGGTDYRIDEKYIEAARLFLNRITD